MKINFRYFSLLIVALFVFPVFTYAAYLASDLLGQLDESDQPVYTKNGANNGPSNRGFSQPIGIALDTVNHRLFVAENANRRVLVFNLDNSNNLIDHLPDNVIGQSGFTTNTSAVTQGGIAGVQGVAYDSINNRLFATDPTNHRVLVFDVSTITNGMNASYVLGQANFTSNSSATTQDGLNGASRVTYYSGDDRLFVSDTSNHRVLVFDVSTITNGMNASYVLGQPDFTTGTSATTQSKMNIPGSPVLDVATQRLFVPEFSNNRVTVWDVDPDTIASGSNAVSVLGQALFTTATAATTQAGLSGPADASFDSATNRLFVSGFNNNRVTVYNVAAITDGENAINVLGQVDFTTGTATTTQSATRTPAGQAYDSANNRLYVSERDNHRVIIFDVASITDGENAVDALGQLDDNDQPVYIKSGSNNAGNRFGFNVPRGMTMDYVHHRLFVVDQTTNNRVLVYNLDTSNNLIDRIPDNIIGQPNFSTIGTATTQAGFNNPSDVAYDEFNDRLFVSEVTNHRVLVFNTATITNGMNASYVIGQADFTSSATGVTQTLVNGQGGLEYDSINSRLFWADGGNSRVLVYDVSPGTMANNLPASYVLGQPNFTTLTATTTQIGMNLPYSGLEYDSSGQRLFVTEKSNNRVTVWDVDPDTIVNGMPASNVLGQLNFTSSAAATTQNGMSQPYDVDFDEVNNRLFVSEGGNGRIMIFDIASITDGENAVAVLGRNDFVTSTAGVTQSIVGTPSNYNGPVGLLYDSGNDRLYYTDSSNHRVLIFNFVSLSSSSLSVAYASNEYSQTVPSTSSQGSVSLTLTSGTLPPGLSLSGGRIIGEPTTLGTYNFSLTATDDNGAIGTFASQPQSYTIVVENPPTSSGSRARTQSIFTPESNSVSPASNPISPTPSTCTITTYLLKLNSRGNDVSCLQQKLNTLLTLNLDTDGIFGPLTKTAVVNFQIKNGLVGDGIVGPLTRGVLK